MENKNAEIEEIRIENRVQLTKVYLGGGDDYITLSGNDVSIFGRFVAAGEQLKEIAEKAGEKGTDAAKNIREELAEREEFSARAAEIMDGVFGEGVTKKFFADAYAVIPGFVPDVECFMDFWDSLIPVMERLSEHKIKLEKLSKERMAKYKPQDHKKK